MKEGCASALRCSVARVLSAGFDPLYALQAIDCSPGFKRAYGVWHHLIFSIMEEKTLVPVHALATMSVYVVNVFARAAGILVMMHRWWTCCGGVNSM